MAVRPRCLPDLFPISFGQRADQADFLGHPAVFEEFGIARRSGDAELFEHIDAKEGPRRIDAIGDVVEVALVVEHRIGSGVELVDPAFAARFTGGWRFAKGKRVVASSIV